MIDKLFIMMKEYDRFTYPPSLSREFKNWVSQKKSKGIAEALELPTEEEAEAAIAEVKKMFEGANKGIRAQREGYTDKDIKDMLKNDVFNEFMEEVGYDLGYPAPKYRILRPEVTRDGLPMSLDEISKQSDSPKRKRAAIRNNMLIDVMRQTLAHPEVSKLLMQPGNFERVKHGSRQQKILHNPTVLREFLIDYKKEIENKGLFTLLQEMSTSALDECYTKYAEPISPLDIIDYVDMQKNLMDGNALIGMFAVNSSNHYKLQFTPLDITHDYQIMINGVRFTKIDLQDSPITGERIGRINAEFQAASPDNGKDPCLGDIGANVKTASRIGFFARLGLSPEMIGMLNTASDFEEFSKGVRKHMLNNRIKLPPIRDFNLDMNKFTLLLAKFRADPGGFDEELAIPENVVFVAQFSEFMKVVKALTKVLNNVSKVSRSDSPNGALAVELPGAIQQYFKAVDFVTGATSPTSPIKGLDKLVNVNLDPTTMSEEDLRDEIMKSPVPRLQAAYTLGIKGGLALCGEWFPGLSKSALDCVQFLRAQIQKELTWDRDLPIVRKFISELTMALLSEDSMFSTTEDATIMDKRNYYIHDFPMKFKSFKEEKNEKNELANPEVVNMNIIQRITNMDGRGLKFRNVGGTSVRSRKHFVEELESLLYSDKAKVIDLAQDLFMYSYYDNGFQFGHSNFGIFFTTTYMKTMSGFIDSLNKGNAKLINGSFNIMNYVYQFILNHPEIARAINPDCYVQEGEKLRLTQKGREAVASGVNKTGEPIMLIQAMGKLWVRNGVGRDLHYVEINYNNTRVPYYDMSKSFDEIDFSALKERGHIGYINPEETENNVANDVPKEDGVDIGEAPEEENIDLSDAPEEEDIDFSDIPLGDEGEGDPEDLEETANLFSLLNDLLNDPRMAALAKSFEDMEMEKPSEPKEESLDDFAPTEDPNTKMCEHKNN